MNVEISSFFLNPLTAKEETPRLRTWPFYCPGYWGGNLEALRLIYAILCSLIKKVQIQWKFGRLDKITGRTIFDFWEFHYLSCIYRKLNVKTVLLLRLIVFLASIEFTSYEVNCEFILEDIGVYTFVCNFLVFSLTNRWP